jgi:hypothetical protein
VPRDRQFRKVITDALSPLIAVCTSHGSDLLGRPLHAYRRPWCGLLPATIDTEADA